MSHSKKKHSLKFCFTGVRLAYPFELITCVRLFFNHFLADSAVKDFFILLN